MTKSQAAMYFKLRHPQTPFYPMNYTPVLSCHRFCRSVFLVLFAVTVSACASTRPRVVDRYSSQLTDPQVESCGLVAMSDQEARKQRAGTTITRKTASSQVVSKNGQIKKQTSEEEDVIETRTSTVVDTIPVPTADQDVRSN
jgi:hypothetical protein